MATYPGIKINHSPLISYAGNSQNNAIGAQSVAGKRGTLPTFMNTNSYFISKSGNDSNAGTLAAPLLTLNSVFKTVPSLFDFSGNSNPLVANGTVPTFSYPCRPLPPAGCATVAGPFSDSAYYTLTTPGTLTGKTAWTVEGWVYIEAIPAGSGASIVWALVDGGGATQLSMASSGVISFSVHGTSVSSAVSSFKTGHWYYYACVFKKNTTGGQQLFFGSSPETVALVASGNAANVTLGTVTQFIFGSVVIPTGYYLFGYIGRPVISAVARTMFPTYGGTSNILTLHILSTQTPLQQNTKSYVVILDSGTYYEALYCPLQYDWTTGFGVYAADGQTPTFTLTRGATAGTYGPNNSARTVTGTPNYYINQTTGNDGTGARNNPSLPFKTIQAALSNGSITNGDVVEVEDNAIYTQDLVFPAGANNVTVRAASGNVPTLRAMNLTMAGIHITISNNGATSTVDGFVLDGLGGLGSMFSGFAGGAINFQNCSFKNYTVICAMGVTMYANNNIYSRNAALASGSNSINVVNCYFDQAPGATLFAISLGLQGWNYTRCTFNNMALTCENDNGINKNIIDQCLFYNCTLVQTDNSVANGNSQYIVTNSMFDKSSYQFIMNTGAASQTAQVLLLNCFQRANGNTFATGYDFQQLNVGILGIQVVSCAAVGNGRNFYVQGSLTNPTFRNCTSLNATTAGYDASSVATADALISSNDAVKWQSGVAPTNSEVGATFLSTVQGAENLALSASDPGIFGAGGLGLNDIGLDWQQWNLVQPTVVNGLTFTGGISGAAALKSTNNSAITAAYCTFSGLGTYAVTGGDGSSFKNCLFSTNGHAIQFSRANITLSNNIAYACGGAFLVNYGQYANLSHNTAYNCQYGQYDASGTGAVSTVNSIYIGSGAYDYHGSAILSYSCVGTIDPATTGSVDAYSTQLDPLFRNATGNDLRVQALAYGYPWQSPVIGAASDGKDMGAWDITYGVASTAWTSIDFGSNDPTTGLPWRNPDKVVRNELPIKLANGDREDGSIYSVSATYKPGYTCTWNESTNDMPLGQMTALLTMFKSFSNSIQINWGDGRGFVNGYFDRQQGFEYTDMTGSYADSSVPEPVKEIVLREA